MLKYLFERQYGAREVHHITADRLSWEGVFVTTEHSLQEILEKVQPQDWISTYCEQTLTECLGIAVVLLFVLLY